MCTPTFLWPTVTFQGLVTSTLKIKIKIKIEGNPLPKKKEFSSQ